jgi:hypothetical protein
MFDEKKLKTKNLLTLFHTLAMTLFSAISDFEVFPKAQSMSQGKLPTFLCSQSCPLTGKKELSRFKRILALFSSSYNKGKSSKLLQFFQMSFIFTTFAITPPTC